MTSASALALSFTGYSAQAQVLPSQSPWTVWVEGGAFLTGGQGINVPTLPGLTAPYTSVGPKGGYYGAAGFDYDYGGSVHLVGDVLYGRSRTATSSTSAHSHFFTGSPGYFSSNTLNSFQTETEHESHFVADLVIGRDFGLGSSTAQFQYGIRVADLTATTSVRQGTTSFFQTFFGSTGVGSSAASGTFKSKFIGVGPRVALTGDVPLSGSWSVDYLLGVAGLGGNRFMSFNVASTTGAGASGNFSAPAFVFNADGWGALSYALTPAYKISGGIRADYYNNVLSTYNVSTGGMHNIDRLFWGPFVRLTGKF